MSEDRKTVLVVGAGFGGIAVALSLTEQGVTEQHNVILVSASESFVIGGCLQYVWSGRASMEDVVYPLDAVKDVCSHVDVRLGLAVTALNAAAKVCELSDGSAVAFDVLVIATGVDGNNPGESIPGLKAATSICSASPAETAGGLEAFFEACKVEEPEQPKPRLLVSIASMPYKCPPAPFEYVFLADDMLRQRGLRGRARVAISCPVAFPFGGPKGKQIFLEECKKKDIEFLPEHVLERVDGEACVAHFDQDRSVDFNFMFSTYPLKAPSFLKDAGLLNAKGFVPVDVSSHRVTGQETANMFAIGDVCWAVMALPKKPHPKAGHFAMQQGLHVGKQIAQILRNEEVNETPDDRAGLCVAETGAGQGILVNPDLTAAVSSSEGKPSFKFTHHEHGEAAKIEWVNMILTKFFGPKVRPFKLGGPVAGAEESKSAN